jgi:hypothetical protein
VNVAAGATRANENIPTPHHRAETTPEEQSTESSFFTSPPGNAVQFGNQGRMHVEYKQEPRLPQVVMCKFCCPKGKKCCKPDD